DSWPPRGDWHGGRWDRGGACFYKDRDFGGDFFCLRRGERREALGRYGDDILSVWGFGRARGLFYDDPNFRGWRGLARDGVSDLRGLAVQGKPGHTWNNRISSLTVQ